MNPISNQTIDLHITSVLSVPISAVNGTSPLSYSALSSNQSIVSNSNLIINGSHLEIIASKSGESTITVNVIDAAQIQGSPTTFVLTVIGNYV